jgi:hypothetical protein
LVIVFGLVIMMRLAGVGVGGRGDVGGFDVGGFEVGGLGVGGAEWTLVSVGVGGADIDAVGAETVWWSGRLAKAIATKTPAPMTPSAAKTANTARAVRMFLIADA